VWQGLIRLARPMQLAIWTGSTLALGLAAAPGLRSGWFLALAMVAVGGIALQGYITHGLNDLYDWESGTDQVTPGTISGGSHVMREGLMDVRRISETVVVAVAAYVVLLGALALWRGPIFWLLGLVALAAGIGYSFPPFRLCYRPLLGEWLGIFPAMTAGVIAAGLAVSGRVTPALLMIGILQGIICNASVMEHHLVDIDSDWAAHPPKRTSPAFWQRALGRPGAEVAAGYQLTAALLGAVAGVFVSPRFWWSTVVGVLGAILALGTHQGDVADETRRDYWLKMLGVVHALGYVAMALGGIGAL
jgi:1,4-dihydroxy-2-naphthoate octaprenyltransferase